MQTIDLTDVEFDLIVATLDQDELKCEIVHKNSICSTEVTHRRVIGCNGNQHNSCQSAVDHFASSAQSHRVEVHDKCQTDIHLCWTHRAI